MPCLKLESCASWDSVYAWFSLLYPGSPVTARRLRHRIECVGERYASEDGDFFKENLDCLVNFDIDLSDYLIDINLTRKVLFKDPGEFILSDELILSNGVVLHLEKFRSKEGLPFTFTLRWLQRLLQNDRAEYSYVKRFVDKIVKACKTFQKRKDSRGLAEFCDLPFDVAPSSKHKQPVDRVEQCGACVKLSTKLDKRSSELLNLLEEERSKCTNLVLQCDLLKGERDALRTSIEELENVKEELMKAKEDLVVSSSLLAEYKKSKLYKRNCLFKKNILKLSAELQQTRQELVNLKAGSNSKISQFKTEICNLKKCLKLEQTMKSKYKLLYKEKDALLKIVEDEVQEGEIVLKDHKNNRYSDSVRLTYMSLMSDANLAAQNCSRAVQIVSNGMFGKKIKMDELPSASTVLNFSKEAYHIAYSHVMERIRNSDHFTLATDGTSRQKRQYLERHVIFNDKCTMSLGFSLVARDDADTLLEKTIEVLDDLCQVYCMTSESCKKDDVFKDTIKKLKGLMSDRAAVNKSFNKKMLEFKKELVGEDESIHFLFCNAHFLLGLVTAVNKAVSSAESQVGKLGRDLLRQFQSFSSSSESAAFRLIRIASDVFGPRGDEKCGCREEWLAYCEMVKRPSKFTSYRTNRFNNLFENASAVIYHRNDICTFLSRYVSHSNLKFQSLLADVQDTTILSLISAIALFHVNFTGPYWLLMNCNSVSYGEFPSYVTQMKTRLDCWSTEEMFFEDGLIESVFCNFPSTDDCELMQFVASSSCNKTIMKSAFASLSQESKVVLERQLDDFLEGGVYGGAVDDDVGSVLNTCPLTNLVGERLFGDLDCDMQRRRNASLHFRSTLNMLKRNKTMSWIRKKSKLSRSKVLRDARKHAIFWVETSRRREKAVRLKIRERIIMNKQAKESIELKKLERKSLALEAVLSHGGICDRKEDFDALLLQPNALEKLKNQIKFRKVVLGENITCTGSTQVLYERLCRHLGFEPSQLPRRYRKRKRE